MTGSPASFDPNGPSPPSSTRWPPRPSAPGCPCGESLRTSTSQVGRWHSGLCDMAGDLNNCVVTCFCPCITFGHNVAALDRGKTTSCRQAAAIWFGFMLVGLSCFCSGYWRGSFAASTIFPTPSAATIVCTFGVGLALSARNTVSSNTEVSSRELQGNSRLLQQSHSQSHA